MKKLIINAMATPYRGDIEDGTEVWGVNRTFHIEPRLTRTYFFDHPRHFPSKYLKPVPDEDQETKLVKAEGDFIEQMKELHAQGIRVISAERSWFDGCEVFDLESLVRAFGVVYFTSSVSYLIAQSILEGFTHVELSGMYHMQDSSEYLHHIPCINAWVMMGIARGMHFDMKRPTAVLSAMPWESALYGYQVNHDRKPALAGLAATYDWARKMPRSWEDYDGNPIHPSEVLCEPVARAE